MAETMCPAEMMAVTYETYHRSGRKPSDAMRAALRALAEMEPTQDMYLAGDKAQDCDESATVIAKAYILAAAEECKSS